MKILFCLGSLQKGGAERVVANLSNYLLKENNVSIVTTVNKSVEYILNENIKIYTLDDKNIIKNKLIRNIKRRNKLKMIVNQIKPDIIISFLPEPTFRVMSLKIDIPRIISERNDPNTEYKSFIYHLLMKHFYKRADGFVFQTRQAMEYFDENIIEKSTIIANPINEKFINKKNVADKEEIIITTGRLTEQKNQKLLINAFSKITNKYPSYRLEIYGEGELRGELEKQINDLNLSEKVFLLGKVDDIEEKLERAKIFVLTSDYEGMPNALMEAMALKLAVISTNCPCGGPETLIDNGKNGILIPTGNEEDLVTALEKLLGDSKYAIELGNEAGKIIEKVNPQKIYNEWEEYINKVLRERKKDGK